LRSGERHGQQHDSDRSKRNGTSSVQISASLIHDCKVPRGFRWELSLRDAADPGWADAGAGAPEAFFGDAVDGDRILGSDENLRNADAVAAFPRLVPVQLRL
jgi:hypothetical protein